MKKQVLTLTAIILAALSLTWYGCGNSNSSQEQHHEQQHHEQHTAAHYQCPMKCEGDKMYDEPGNCSVCGMELKKVEE